MMNKVRMSKLGSLGLRGLSAGSSIGVPLMAILEKFPLWAEGKVDAKKLGVGGVMAAIVLLVGLRHQIWPILKGKLHITSAWAIGIWAAFFGILLGIEKIVPLLPDLRSICIAGLSGTAVGQGLNTIAGILDPTGKIIKEKDLNAEAGTKSS